MRKSALSLAFACALLLAFSGTPLAAQADPQPSRGFFLDFGDGAGLAFRTGHVRFARRPRARAHRDTHWSYENELRAQRARLITQTSQAFQTGRFTEAQVHLTQLIEVDERLKRHQAAHGR